MFRGDHSFVLFMVRISVIDSDSLARKVVTSNHHLQVTPSDLGRKEMHFGQIAARPCSSCVAFKADMVFKACSSLICLEDRAVVMQLIKEVRNPAYGVLLNLVSPAANPQVETRFSKVASHPPLGGHSFKARKGTQWRVSTRTTWVTRLTLHRNSMNFRFKTPQLSSTHLNSMSFESFAMLFWPISWNAILSVWLHCKQLDGLWSFGRWLLLRKPEHCPLKLRRIKWKRLKKLTSRKEAEVSGTETPNQAKLSIDSVGNAAKFNHLQSPVHWGGLRPLQIDLYKVKVVDCKRPHWEERWSGTWRPFCQQRERWLWIQ